MSDIFFNRIDFIKFGLEPEFVGRLPIRVACDPLDSDKYFTDFALEGRCNYAFTLVLKQADEQLCVQVVQTLNLLNVEFRRGIAGGGNQLRQPYFKAVKWE